MLKEKVLLEVADGQDATTNSDSAYQSGLVASITWPTRSGCP